MTDALFQHQSEGADWLVERPKGYLADPPGLGKTRTLITAAIRAGLQRPLIVCPAIVRSHWEREFEAMGFAGTPYVESYDTITRGGYTIMARYLREERIDGLILDEAHYLKHASSARTKMILGRDGYARRLEVVWPASGTPLPKNPAEIWTVLSSLFPGVALSHGLRTYDDFLEKHCIVQHIYARGEMRRKVVGVKPETQAELQAMLGKVMRVGKPMNDVPALHWQTIRLDGGATMQDFADSVTPQLIQHLDAGTLEEIANDPHVSRMRRRLGELKVAPVAEMVSSQLANSNEKLVIFAHHTGVLAGLAELLRTFEPVVVDGSTSDRARDAARSRFMDDERCRIYIGQNQAAGTGNDGLQKVANRAILVEPSWTAAENVQMGRRIARYGTIGGHGVAQMIALAGTLDEAIVAQCNRETRMVEAAMPLGV